MTNEVVCDRRTAGVQYILIFRMSYNAQKIPQGNHSATGTVFIASRTALNI